MSRLLILICFSSLTLITTAQQKKLDSLREVMSRHPQQDTVRLRLLIQVANCYNTINPSKGSETGDTAIALALALHDRRGLAWAMLYKAGNDNLRMALKAAGDSLKKVLAIYEELQDHEGITRALAGLGYTYYSMSDISKALDYHQRALAMAKEYDVKALLGNIYSSLGNDYVAISDYPHATECFQQSQDIYEQLGNKIGIGAAGGNLAIIYIHSFRYTQAIRQLKKMYVLFEKEGDKKDMSQALQNMGVAYENLNNNDSALYCFRQSLAIDSSIRRMGGVANNLLNIGDTYNSMKLYGAGLDYMRQSAALFKEQGSKGALAMAYTGIGSSLVGIDPKDLKGRGIRPPEQYNQAVGYLKTAIDLTKNGDAGQESIEWGELSMAYEKQGKFALALDAHKHFKELKDSLYNQDKDKALASKEIQYEYEKKAALVKADNDKKQALALAETSRQRIVRNVVTGGAILLGLAAVFSLVFYKRRRDAEGLKKEAEFKALVSDTEMKALRVQMNPHFIFNSLNSVSDYISRNEPATANKYLVKFAGIMRLILENSEQKEIPLADDLKALELYMQLEALRLRDGFTYEIKIDSDIDADNTLVPPLILQPFVENSIWHGLAGKQGQGKILIHISRQGEMIKCTVEDNGVGRQQAEKAPVEMTVTTRPGPARKSFGIKITGERIAILNRTRKTHASIKISDLQQGTRVDVVLPMELQF